MQNMLCFKGDETILTTRRVVSWSALALLAVACEGEPEGKPAAMPLRGVASLSVGAKHSCALLHDGTARCWGDNVSGQLGDGNTVFAEPTPVKVKGLGGVRALATGGAHTCALRTEGTVDCWGRNLWGELGTGSELERVVTPMPVPTLEGVVAVAVGSTASGKQGYSCAVRKEGTVACWGRNASARKPSGVTTVAGISDARSISLGSESACALGAAGTVSCWMVGSFGADSERAFSPPAPVPELSGVVALASGEAHHCALLSAGTVRCWGSSREALGNPAAKPEDAVVAVQGLERVKAITAAGYYTCALLVDGSVSCWGRIVPGRREAVPVPSPVGGLSDVVAVHAGAFFACALSADGTVKCWGHNRQGELGTGEVGEAVVATPTTVIAGG